MARMVALAISQVATDSDRIGRSLQDVAGHAIGSTGEGYAAVARDALRGRRDLEGVGFELTFNQVLPA